MITLRALGVAVGVAFAASSFALAQDNNPGANNPGANNPGTNNAGTSSPGANKPGANNPAANNPPANAAAGGSSGTQQTAPKTGAAANTHNRQGPKHVASRQGRQVHGHSRHLVAFVPSWRCRMLLREGRPLAKGCRRY